MDIFGRKKLPEEEVVGMNAEYPEIYDQKIYDAGEELAKTSDRGLGIYNGEMLNAKIEKIGKKDIEKAMEILNEYKSGKATLEARILEEEDYYMLQWNKRAKQKLQKDANGDCPNSAWLFNVLTNKHADAMDSFPEPVCLPREQSDEKEAEKLNSILPVIFEQNGFEQIYSDVWWYKLKHGTGAYSVMWNPENDNGLGNIDIQKVDLLNIFWEPGIKNIQDSPNLFTVELISNEVLKSQYPELEDKQLGEGNFSLGKYNHDDSDTSKKTLVIDWYYKRKVGGKTILHYCKFVNDTVLYASENDIKYASRGFYDHGKYPFVFDSLYPDETSPAGIGMIAISRDPQTYIDLLDKYILDYAQKASKVRWLADENGGINEDEWNDWDKPVVHVQGGKPTDERYRFIDVPGMSPIVFNERDSKVNELKETANNRDFSNGSTASGVTSGAAIATLQEAGNKTSRDIIKSSYRAFVQLNHIVIELIRQFYTEERSFRIKNPNGAGYDFINYSSKNLAPQSVMMETNGVSMPMTDAYGNEVQRVPIIDIDVRAQKQSPFTTAAQNETAMNLYNAGFFEPERAQQALICLEMMDFEAKDKVYEYVIQGQTLQNMVNQLNQQIAQASQMLAMSGINPMQFGLMPVQMPQGNMGGGQMAMSNPVSVAQNNASDRVNTPYMQDLIDRARV